VANSSQVRPISYFSTPPSRPQLRLLHILGLATLIKTFSYNLFY
jgi:hypothetical protein